MCFAWQGWKISLPADWNPQRIEGDFDNGYALIADLHGPRLGMRWTTAKAIDIDRALSDEVGKLAAEEAIAVDRQGWLNAKLYIEPKPPGRDVWIAQSNASKRVIQLTLHRKANERSKLSGMVEKLSDIANEPELTWAVFDLSCKAAAKWKLSSKALNAGDLALSFSDGSESLTCRQLALAQIALKRQPIDRWLSDLQQPHKPRYRADDATTAIQWTTVDGRDLCGVAGTMSRKSWLGWAWHLPRRWSFVAVHDEARDRLVLAQSTRADALEDVCRSIGSVN
jgi:hypothetical protein